MSGHCAFSVTENRKQIKTSKCLNILLSKFGKFVSRVLFHCSLLNNISTIYLCDLPVAALNTIEIRRVALNTATYLAFQHPRFTQQHHHWYCLWALTSHFHYHREDPSGLAATWFSVALSVTKTFLFSHPSFQMADHPLLPGLSSPAAITRQKR